MKLHMMASVRRRNGRLPMHLFVLFASGLSEEAEVRPYGVYVPISGREQAGSDLWEDAALTRAQYAHAGRASLPETRESLGDMEYEVPEGYALPEDRGGVVGNIRDSILPEGGMQDHSRLALGSQARQVSDKVRLPLVRRETQRQHGAAGAVASARAAHTALVHEDRRIVQDAAAEVEAEAAEFRMKSRRQARVHHGGTTPISLLATEQVPETVSEPELSDEPQHDESARDPGGLVPEAAAASEEPGSVAADDAAVPAPTLPPELRVPQAHHNPCGHLERRGKNEMPIVQEAEANRARTKDDTRSCEEIAREKARHRNRPSGPSGSRQEGVNDIFDDDSFGTPPDVSNLGPVTPVGRFERGSDLPPPPESALQPLRAPTSTGVATVPDSGTSDTSGSTVIPQIQRAEAVSSTSSDNSSSTSLLVFLVIGGVLFLGIAAFAFRAWRPRHAREGHLTAADMAEHRDGQNADGVQGSTETSGQQAAEVSVTSVGGVEGEGANGEGLSGEGSTAEASSPWARLPSMPSAGQLMPSPGQLGRALLFGS